jgi:recombinational DNA repair protein RecT
VPYKDSVQLQIGYKGMIQLLFRAGWVVKCSPVYACDTFRTINDPNGWDKGIEFEENIDERDEGDKDWVFENLRGIYVVARHADTKDQYSTFVGKKVIEKLRLNSPNQRANQWSKPADKARLDAGLPIGIWADWYVEMAQAKAIKKLAKILPIGDSRASLALVVDDKAEIGQRVDYNKTAESGVVIDVEEMEAKPAKKSKVTVDSLIGGQKSDSIQEQTKAPEPSVPDEAPDFGDFTPEPPPFVDDVPTSIVGELMPQSMGTMPIPELQAVPPVKPSPVDEWKAKIDSWETVSDVARTLNEMPHSIKEILKPYYTTKNEELRARLIVDVPHWAKRISDCNSREQFMALQKEMPQTLRSDERIKSLLSQREEFGANSDPENW